MPTDFATTAERAAIQSSLSAISEMMAKLGKPNKLDRIQILVMKPTRQKLHGICVQRKKSRYILIARSVLDKHLSEDTSNEVDERLFMVLLHEIGHCYFGREHDDALVASVPGSSLTTETVRGRTIHMFQRTEVPASVMHSTGAEGHGLKEYYVAELLGLARARNWKDLERYGAKVVPR